VLGVQWHIQNFLQYYHSWIHPLHQSPLSPSPHSWNSFNSSHFSIYINVYTIFAPYSPSYTLSPNPPLSTGTNFPDKNRSALLFSYFV
jgi:hypothetical protein